MLLAYNVELVEPEGVAVPAYLGDVMGMVAGSDQGKWRVEHEDENGRLVSLSHGAWLRTKFETWLERTQVAGD
jgi:hypothetical protein